MYKTTGIKMEEEAECFPSFTLAGIASSLTHLDASDTGIRSISGVSELKNLFKLDLSGCILLESLAGIQSQHKLVDIDLSFCERLKFVNQLYGMTGLRRLDLTGCILLEDIDELKKNLQNCKIIMP
jgi:Leucine-rich repeat (LRR) protein